MTSPPFISIIFPVHNGGIHPARCLDTIAKLNYPKSKLEVIVVDNHSTDKSLKQLPSIFSKVEIISLNTNLGFARAINVAAARAKGEYLFIGNDDLRFEPRSLSVLSNYLYHNPKVGVCGGAIFSLRVPHLLISTGYHMNRWTGNISPTLIIQKISQPDWIQGCALLTRKKLFDQVGGLDEGFEYFFEDYDYCVRVKKIGYQLASIPEAHFWHGESTTANKNRSLKYQKWYKAKFRFILKHLPWINVFSIVILQYLLILPYRAIIRRDGRLEPLCSGTWWNILHLPQTLLIRYANR